MIRKLTELCSNVWESKEAPADWKDGVILPIPKKGDLTDCNNRRRVTLLSAPGKVMATIILERIKDAVDRRLSQEQAGLRRGR